MTAPIMNVSVSNCVSLKRKQWEVLDVIMAISGPHNSGKSTIINLLKTQYKDAVFIPDCFEEVWNELLDDGMFQEFTELYRDRDLLITYLMRVIDRYNKYIEKYKSYEGLVFVENCFFDYFIYRELQFFYHYPLVQAQEVMTIKLLKSKRYIDKIYMTTANDGEFPVNTRTKLKKRQVSSAFLRNRSLELSLYEFYSESKRVKVLPSSSLEAARVIIDDINKPRS